ncbi:Hpt domain-containing protein [Brevundimonas sp.]|uniref:Hpt domain-containing protein n=1 Tax=Brevundimonas sp. TaxID=1871086 RepID=UPI003BAD7750
MSDPLAALRERFRARLNDDLERLRGLRAATGKEAELRMLAHSLAGAAGTFGYPALSAVAVTVDDRHASGERPTEAELDALETAIASVIASA